MSQGTHRIRVLVVEDHPIFRDGISGLLASRGFDVVGAAETGTEGLALALELVPDVVMMDLTLPDLDGTEVTRRLVQQQPDAAVIVVSMHEDEALVRAALAAGARGYVVKGARQDELVRAVETVAGGDVVLGRAVADSVLGSVSRDALTPEGAPIEGLTARESSILELLAQGLSTGIIARRLEIAPKTVRNNVSSILVKLGAQDRVAAVLLARARGFGRVDGGA